MPVGRPFAKGNKGRPKGAVNKTTVLAKEAYQLAFDGLGGWEGMMAWAKRDPDNLKAFYAMYARLIPMDVTSKDERITVTFVPHGGATEGA